MIEIIDKKKCAGCYACYNKCPQNAITMQEDAEGFKYPVIDKERCINCGLCEKVCPCLEIKEEKQKELEIYAAWSKDEFTRIDSTSGGIFSELANAIYLEKGYVCAAIYNKEWMVEHYISGNSEDIINLRSSKYLQSDINDNFRKIKEKLDKDEKVLFCGSPCQVSGLYNFLTKEYENLYTVDFICRGMNSPKVFKGYIKSLEKKYSSKVKAVKFKNKTFGWHNFSTKIEFENGKKYIKGRYFDSYMVGYLKYNAFIRPSCYNCNFKSIVHKSDMTIADFWGIENIDKNLDQDKGTSMVLVNSEKGKKLFEKIMPKIQYKQIESENVFLENVCINKSVEMTENRKLVFENIDKLDYDELSAKYFPIPKGIEKIKIIVNTNKKLKNIKNTVKKIIKR